MQYLWSAIPITEAPQIKWGVQRKISFRFPLFWVFLEGCLISFQVIQLLTLSVNLKESDFFGFFHLGCLAAVTKNEDRQGEGQEVGSQWYEEGKWGLPESGG